MRNPYLGQSQFAQSSRSKKLKIYIPVKQFTRNKQKIYQNSVSKTNKRLISNLFVEKLQKQIRQRQPQQQSKSKDALKKLHKRNGTIDQKYLRDIQWRLPKSPQKNSQIREKKIISKDTNLNFNFDFSSKKVKAKRFSISRMLQTVEVNGQTSIEQNYRTLHQILGRSFTLHEANHDNQPQHISRTFSEKKKRNQRTMVQSQRSPRRRAANNFQGILNISKLSASSGRYRYQRFDLQQSLNANPNASPNSSRCHSRGLSVHQYNPTSYKNVPAKPENWSLQAWRSIQKSDLLAVNNPQLQRDKEATEQIQVILQ